LWYKRDRLGWRDLLPLAPMLLLGVSMGLMTAYLEREHVLAEGPEWAFGFADRVLIAGRALWFYAGKVFWPRKLIFIYPRWKIDPSAWWQWVYPAAAIGVMAGLALARKRIGKGPLAAVLLFVGTLFPALGFLNVYPMRYSFVADHFQYLACISLIALAAAAAARAFTRAGSRWRAGAVVLGGGLLVLLAVTTWRQGHIYRDRETLWLDTLAKDPGCWMAHHNYGLLLQDRGRIDEAIARYREALRLKPDNHRALTNLGVALGEKGRTDEAIARYRQAVLIQPDYAYAHFCLAHALRRNGRLEEAIHHYRQALRIQPQSAPAHFYLADCLLRQAHPDQAIEHFSRAVQLEPDHAESHVRLADALKLRGRAVEAAEHYGRALRLRADFPTALNGLAQLRATSPDPALRDGAEAVRLAQRACRLTQYAHPVLLDTLAAAYAEAGRFDEAITTAEKALKLAQDPEQTDFAARVASRLELYRNGRPYRLSPAP
jgi:tetratricopeptide (TPR) repeat protein